MGNLTRDPEVRTIPSGMTVCEITLAVNEKYKDKETVSFVDVTVWGKQAETLARWKKKGEPLLVEGKLRQESWTDKQTGQKRSKMKVVCERFTFVGGGQGGGKSRRWRPARRRQLRRREPRKSRRRQPRWWLQQRRPTRRKRLRRRLRRLRRLRHKPA